MNPLRLAILASGQGTNLQNIHQQISSGAIPGVELALVVSNNSASGAMSYAREHHIPTEHISAHRSGSQSEADEALLRTLREHKIDLIVLAGYMKKIPLSVVREYSGRIINVASRAAFRGDSPQHWHYAASKAAMVGMTKTIARGYAGEGILCFGVAPGFTVSEMTAEYLQGRGGAQIIADIPLGRVASTDEVAEVIRWLSTEAPSSATGSIIDVNGASYVR